MMQYYWACHWESRHDLARQRECLDKAVRANPEDVDVLIARYRLPGDRAATTPRSSMRSSGPP